MFRDEKVEMARQLERLGVDGIEAGIHQHGVLSNPLCYGIMTPQSVGVPANDIAPRRHFYNNGFKNGLLAIMLDDEAVSPPGSRSILTGNTAFKMGWTISGSRSGMRMRSVDSSRIGTKICLF